MCTVDLPEVAVAVGIFQSDVVQNPCVRRWRDSNIPPNREGTLRLEKEAGDTIRFTQSVILGGTPLLMGGLGGR